MLEALDAGTVVRMVEGALRYQDHFALVAAFEICAASVEKDVRFIALGEQLLDRLVKDITWLKNACRLFATIFVVATARFALHDIMRDRPGSWRRLAAPMLAPLTIRRRGAGA